MVPRKARTIIPEAARELNLSEKVVDDVVSFYYKELRAALSRLDFPAIKVIGLGIFKIKTKVIYRVRDNYLIALEKSSPIEFKEFKRRKYFEERIARMDKMIGMMEEENKRRKAHLEKRYGKKAE